MRFHEYSPCARFLTLSLACAALAMTGCADPERDEHPSSGSGFEGGNADEGDSTDGGGADDGGGSDDGAGDDGSDDAAADGSTGDGADGADSGPSEEAPDCTQWWIGQYIPSQMYMDMKTPETAEEMFCYVNMERINYSFHTRNNGCVWDHDGDPQLSWPYEMEFSAELTAEAQAEADAVAGGAPPAGQAGSNGINFGFFVDGCASNVYTVTSVNDDYNDWPAASLSKNNGSARMGVFYYDPGPGNPVLTKLGVGMAKSGDMRNWVIKFGD